jgi:hypothetical protein
VSEANRVATALRRAASIPLAIGILVYEALNRTLGPLIRPVVTALGELNLFHRMGALIRRLPPYGVLALLAVPFVIIEPLKAVSLYWMAVGHPLQGGVAFIACHLLSLLTSERILHVGKPQLLTIGWFARGYGFAVALGDRARAWIRTTAAWRASRALARAARAAADRALARLRGA